ncbi:MAG: hypothetical protein JW937_07145, partial [Candidatus Omnitrophica bacterium]|nr:hypothetical protein [Candidatus Omnitrophota bacterium]
PLSDPEVISLVKKAVAEMQRAHEGRNEGLARDERNRGYGRRVINMQIREDLGDLQAGLWRKGDFLLTGRRFLRAAFEESIQEPESSWAGAVAYVLNDAEGMGDFWDSVLSEDLVFEEGSEPLRQLLLLRSVIAVVDVQEQEILERLRGISDALGMAVSPWFQTTSVEAEPLLREAADRLVLHERLQAVEELLMAVIERALQIREARMARNMGDQKAAGEAALLRAFTEKANPALKGTEFVAEETGALSLRLPQVPETALAEPPARPEPEEEKRSVKSDFLQNLRGQMEKQLQTLGPVAGVRQELLMMSALVQRGCTIGKDDRALELEFIIPEGVSDADLNSLHIRTKGPVVIHTGHSGDAAGRVQLELTENGWVSLEDMSVSSASTGESFVVRKGALLGQDAEGRFHVAKGFKEAERGSEQLMIVARWSPTSSMDEELLDAMKGKDEVAPTSRTDIDIWDLEGKPGLYGAQGFIEINGRDLVFGFEGTKIAVPEGKEFTLGNIQWQEGTHLQAYSVGQNISFGLGLPEGISAGDQDVVLARFKGIPVPEADVHKVWTAQLAHSLRRAQGDFLDAEANVQHEKAFDPLVVKTWPQNELATQVQDEGKRLLTWWHTDALSQILGKGRVEARAGPSLGRIRIEEHRDLVARAVQESGTEVPLPTSDPFQRSFASLHPLDLVTPQDPVTLAERASAVAMVAMHTGGPIANIVRGTDEEALTRAQYQQFFAGFNEFATEAGVGEALENYEELFGGQQFNWEDILANPEAMEALFSDPLWSFRQLMLDENGDQLRDLTEVLTLMRDSRALYDNDDPRTQLFFDYIEEIAENWDLDLGPETPEFVPEIMDPNLQPTTVTVAPVAETEDETVSETEEVEVADEVEAPGQFTSEQTTVTQENHASHTPAVMGLGVGAGLLGVGRFLFWTAPKWMVWQGFGGAASRIVRGRSGRSRAARFAMGVAFRIVGTALLISGAVAAFTLSFASLDQPIYRPLARWALERMGKDVSLLEAWGDIDNSSVYWMAALQTLRSAETEAPELEDPAIQDRLEQNDLFGEEGVKSEVQRAIDEGIELSRAHALAGSPLVEDYSETHPREYWQSFLDELPTDQPLITTLNLGFIHQLWMAGQAADRDWENRPLDHLFNALAQRPDLYRQYLSELAQQDDNMIIGFSRHFASLRENTRRPLGQIQMDQLRNDWGRREQLEADPDQEVPSSLIQQTDEQLRLYAAMSDFIAVIRPLQAGVLPEIPEGYEIQITHIGLTFDMGLRHMLSSFTAPIRDLVAQGYTATIPSLDSGTASNVSLLAGLVSYRSDFTVDTFYRDQKAARLLEWVETTVAERNQMITLGELWAQALILHTDEETMTVDVFGAWATMGHYFKAMARAPELIEGGPRARFNDANGPWFMGTRFDHRVFMAWLDPLWRGIVVGPDLQPVLSVYSVDADGNTSGPNGRIVREYLAVDDDLYHSIGIVLMAGYIYMKGYEEIVTDQAAYEALYPDWDPRLSSEEAVIGLFQGEGSLMGSLQGNDRSVNFDPTSQYIPGLPKWFSLAIQRGVEREAFRSFTWGDYSGLAETESKVLLAYVARDFFRGLLEEGVLQFREYDEGLIVQGGSPEMLSVVSGSEAAFRDYYARTVMDWQGFHSAASAASGETIAMDDLIGIWRNLPESSRTSFWQTVAEIQGIAHILTNSGQLANFPLPIALREIRYGIVSLRESGENVPASMRTDLGANIMDSLTEADTSLTQGVQGMVGEGSVMEVREMPEIQTYIDWAIGLPIGTRALLLRGLMTQRLTSDREVVALYEELHDVLYVQGSFQEQYVEMIEETFNELMKLLVSESSAPDLIRRVQLLHDLFALGDKRTVLNFNALLEEYSESPAELLNVLQEVDDQQGSQNIQTILDAIPGDIELVQEFSRLSNEIAVSRLNAQVLLEQLRAGAEDPTLNSEQVARLRTLAELIETSLPLLELESLAETADEVGPISASVRLQGDPQEVLQSLREKVEDYPATAQYYINSYIWNGQDADVLIEILKHPDVPDRAIMDIVLFTWQWPEAINYFLGMDEKPISSVFALSQTVYARGGTTLPISMIDEAVRQLRDDPIGTALITLFNETSLSYEDSELLLQAEPLFSLARERNSDADYSNDIDLVALGRSLPELSLEAWVNGLRQELEASGEETSMLQPEIQPQNLTRGSPELQPPLQPQTPAAMGVGMLGSGGAGSALGVSGALSRMGVIGRTLNGVGRLWSATVFRGMGQQETESSRRRRRTPSILGIAARGLLAIPVAVISVGFVWIGAIRQTLSLSNLIRRAISNRGRGRPWRWPALGMWGLTVLPASLIASAAIMVAPPVLLLAQTMGSDQFLLWTLTGVEAAEDWLQYQALYDPNMVSTLTPDQIQDSVEVSAVERPILDHYLTQASALAVQDERIRFEAEDFDDQGVLRPGASSSQVGGESSRQYWEAVFADLPAGVALLDTLGPELWSALYQAGQDPLWSNQASETGLQEIRQTRPLDHFFNALLQDEELLLRYLDEVSQLAAVHSELVTQFAQYVATLKPGTRQRMMRAFLNELRPGWEREESQIRNSGEADGDLADRNRRWSILYTVMTDFVRGRERSVVGLLPSAEGYQFPVIAEGAVTPSHVAFTRSQAEAAIANGVLQVLNSPEFAGAAIVSPQINEINTSDLISMLIPYFGRSDPENPLFTWPAAFFEGSQAGRLALILEERDTMITWPELVAEATRLHQDPDTGAINLPAVILTIEQLLIDGSRREESTLSMGEALGFRDGPTWAGIFDLRIFWPILDPGLNATVGDNGQILLDLYWDVDANGNINFVDAVDGDGNVLIPAETMRTGEWFPAVEDDLYSSVIQILVFWLVQTKSYEQLYREEMEALNAHGTLDVEGVEYDPEAPLDEADVDFDDAFTTLRSIQTAGYLDSRQAPRVPRWIKHALENNFLDLMMQLFFTTLSRDALGATAGSEETAKVVFGNAGIQLMAILIGSGRLQFLSSEENSAAAIRMVRQWPTLEAVLGGLDLNEYVAGLESRWAALGLGWDPAGVALSISRNGEEFVSDLPAFWRGLGGFYQLEAMYDRELFDENLALFSVPAFIGELSDLYSELAADEGEDSAALLNLQNFLLTAPHEFRVLFGGSSSSEALSFLMGGERSVHVLAAIARNHDTISGSEAEQLARHSSWMVVGNAVTHPDLSPEVRTEVLRRVLEASQRFEDNPLVARMNGRQLDFLESMQAMDEALINNVGLQEYQALVKVIEGIVSSQELSAEERELLVSSSTLPVSVVDTLLVSEDLSSEALENLLPLSLGTGTLLLMLTNHPNATPALVLRAWEQASPTMRIVLAGYAPLPAQVWCDLVVSSRMRTPQMEEELWRFIGNRNLSPAADFITELMLSYVAESMPGVELDLGVVPEQGLPEFPEEFLNQLEEFQDVFLEADRLRETGQWDESLFDTLFALNWMHVEDTPVEDRLAACVNLELAVMAYQMLRMGVGDAEVLNGILESSEWASGPVLETLRIADLTRTDTSRLAAIPELGSDYLTTLAVLLLASPEQRPAVFQAMRQNMTRDGPFEEHPLALMVRIFEVFWESYPDEMPSPLQVRALTVQSPALEIAAAVVPPEVFRARYLETTTDAVPYVMRSQRLMPRSKLGALLETHWQSPIIRALDAVALQPETTPADFRILLSSGDDGLLSWAVEADRTSFADLVVLSRGEFGLVDLGIGDDLKADPFGGFWRDRSEERVESNRFYRREIIQSATERLNNTQAGRQLLQLVSESRTPEQAVTALQPAFWADPILRYASVVLNDAQWEQVLQDSLADTDLDSRVITWVRNVGVLLPQDGSTPVEVLISIATLSREVGIEIPISDPFNSQLVHFMTQAATDEEFQAISDLLRMSESFVALARERIGEEGALGILLSGDQTGNAYEVALRGLYSVAALLETSELDPISSLAYRFSFFTRGGLGPEARDLAVEMAGISPLYRQALALLGIWTGAFYSTPEYMTEEFLQRALDGLSPALESTAPMPASVVASLLEHDFISRIASAYENGEFTQEQFNRAWSVVERYRSETQGMEPDQMLEYLVEVWLGALEFQLLAPSDPYVILASPYASDADLQDCASVQFRGVAENTNRRSLNAVLHLVLADPRISPRYLTQAASVSVEQGQYILSAEDLTAGTLVALLNQALNEGNTEQIGTVEQRLLERGPE